MGAEQRKPVTRSSKNDNRQHKRRRGNAGRERRSPRLPGITIRFVVLIAILTLLGWGLVLFFLGAAATRAEAHFVDRVQAEEAVQSSNVGGHCGNDRPPVDIWLCWHQDTITSFCRRQVGRHSWLCDAGWTEQRLKGQRKRDCYAKNVTVLHLRVIRITGESCRWQK